MRFTSSVFVFFFVILFVLYWTIPGRSFKNTLLLCASYLFYGWLHPWYGIVLFVLTLIDYFICQIIQQETKYKYPLRSLSLAINFGALIFFKYNDFFIAGLQNKLTSLGIAYNLSMLHLLFPLGLSFYVLKKSAYIIDVAQKRIAVERNFINYALFVAFFPQITSGPIDRAQNLLPQISNDRPWDMDNLRNAWPLIILGFLKKLVVADSLTVIVDRIFALQQPSILIVLIGALGFTFQLLADFSAYTDLSRGFSFLLGFRTPENFNSPYASTTPTDFWNRWHITLSEWLRDYIFFPLRRALLRSKFKASKSAALFIPPLAAMLVSGFWHGTGWTYLIWGFYYGILIIIYQVAGFGGAWKPKKPFSLFTARLLMFCFIMFGWLIFRSPSLPWLINVAMYSEWYRDYNELIAVIVNLCMIAGYSAPLFVYPAIQVIRKPFGRNLLEPAFYAIAAAAVLVYLNSSSPDFLYFQF
ncbi:MAG: MBOAT family protein [Anaerolineaceae bacterium]|nr:MBOAT family protein [Anaerolineaceae bacterium]